MKSYAIVAVFALTACTNKTVNQAPDDAIVNLVEQKRTASGAVGLAAAIIVGKELVWTKGFGYADAESEKPFTPQTIMNIASITKTITGTSVMHAVGEGKLSLDEDVNAYLPFKVTNPNFPNEKVTIRHLATHTSGIIDRLSVYDSSYYFGGDAPEPLGDFLKSYFDTNGRLYSKENFLSAKPGAQYEYSNIGAGLAGYIVEVVTGQKLNEYSADFLFKPLEMDDTGWFLSEVDMDNHAKLYYYSGDTLKSHPFYGLTTYPDGGVRTSVEDLSKFLIFLLNEGKSSEGTQILDEDLVKQMLTQQFTSANKPENVDLEKQNAGIFWAVRENGARISHSGGDPGVITRLQYNLDKEVGLIVFCNTSLSAMMSCGTLLCQCRKSKGLLRVNKIRRRRCADSQPSCWP
jgi:CubicO group peptidase (beta-lactamase class C family)